MRRHRTGLAAAAATAALVLLAGCTGDTGDTGGSTGSRPHSSSAGGPLPAPSASSAPAPGGSPAPTPVGRAAALAATGRPGEPQDVVIGLDVPWTVAPLPDGTVLVTERDTARVVRVGADGSRRQVTAPGPGGAVPGVTPRGEGGLLGLAVSPGFAADGVLYAYRTSGDTEQVVRMVLTGGGPGAADGGRLSAPQVVLSGIPAGTVHHGGRMAFGPDGMLYVSTGEAGDPPAAQDLSSLGGKVLRITPDGAPAPGNPFPGSPVWTSGHRNVQGFGWDAAGRMFEDEFGQDRQDELNLLEPGKDYGWPRVEGFLGSDADRARYTDPLLTWSTDEASPSGMLVTGDALYVTALRGERLWRVPLRDGVLGTPEALYTGRLGRLRDVALGPDGALWVLTSNTFRGDPRPGDDRLVRLPLA